MLQSSREPLLKKRERKFKNHHLKEGNLKKGKIDQDRNEGIATKLARSTLKNDMSYAKHAL